MTSINFDDSNNLINNQLCSEEESDQEDGNQQDEIKKQLESAFGEVSLELSGTSSDDDEEDDDDDEPKNQESANSNQPLAGYQPNVASTHNHHNHHGKTQHANIPSQYHHQQQPNNAINDINNEASAQDSNTNNNQGGELGFNNQINNEMQHDMTMFPPTIQQHMIVAGNNTIINGQMTPGVHFNSKPINGNINGNFLMNQFSTPSNNQNVPLPQALQATAIQTNQDFRQRTAANNNETIPIEAYQDHPGGTKYNQPYQHQIIDQNDHDIENGNNQIDNLTHINGTINNNANQYNIQQQHYVHRSKMHSIERFAAPSPPQPQLHNLYNNNDLLEHDPELNIEQVNEDDDFGDGKNGNTEMKEIVPNNKIQGTMLNIDYKAHDAKNEVSIFDSDLDKLDPAQLQQFKEEEEKHMQLQQQQSEFFTLEYLNRQLYQAHILYKIRGKKLDEVTNRYTEFQDSMARQMRSMQHQVSLAERGREEAKTSLEQAHQLCSSYKAEAEQAVQSQRKCIDDIEILKKENRQLEAKLNEYEQEIDSLHGQINEQQKMDSQERIREQHENYIQSLRNKYENDLLGLREKICQYEADIYKKNERIKLLQSEMSVTAENLEKALYDKAETVNRMTQNLNDLQAKYNKELMIFENNKILLSKDNEAKTNLIEQLTQKCNDLEQRLRSNADQTTLTIENTTERIQQNHQQQPQQYQLTPTTTTNPSIKTFQGELDRALTQLKQKRAEVHQKELDIERLNKLVDELEQEKRELVAELEEKSSKLNQMLTLEENFQQLETDLFNKQNQIEEYQNMIQSLQEKNQDVDNHQLLMLNQKYHQVDAQLAELKVMLAKKDSELSRTKEMYVEVCEQKNNLQDTLKLQFDAEYEAKLKDKVENVISNRLEEQKIFLNAEFNRKLDANLDEIKALNDALNKLKMEKINMELTSSRTESQFKDRIINMERALKEKELELNDFKAKLESESIKFRNEKSELNEKYQDILRKFNEERAQSEKASQLKQLKDNEEMESRVNQLELGIGQEKQTNDRLSKELTKLEASLEQERSKLALYELDVNKLRQENVDLSGQLDHSKKQWTQVKSNLNEEIEQSNKLKLKLEQVNELNEKLKKDLSDMNEKFKQDSTTLTEEASNQFIRLKTRAEQLEAELSKQRELNEKLRKEAAVAVEKFDQSIKQWQMEKEMILKKAEEDSQKHINQIEKRFEEDYSKFIQTHKDAIQRIVFEKSQEHEKEKEKLKEIYQNKFNEYESNEQALLKQLKEAKERLQVKKQLIDAKCQTDFSNEVDQDYINELLEKIKTLEECINSTDEHFEIELEKLRNQLEEEYKIKLESELENMDKHNNDLSIAESDSSSINPKKYSKIKEELNLKEKEMETIEQAYRIKLDEIHGKFDAHLEQMKSKYETDLQRSKQELSDNYKQTLLKSKNEIDQMQTLVQRLKKSNSDSNRVIESLKNEMKKIKEHHYDELTMLKINSEREKENLKEDCEQTMRKVQNLERQLNESEESKRKQIELLRAELKAEYGYELNKMNNKMKDMMKSHSNSIEILKRQHHSAHKLATNQANTVSNSIQTDMEVKDIESLEAGRQKYLEILTKMKSDMVKEFEAQAIRLSERASRQTNDERIFIKEKIMNIFMPKIVDLLKEFRISDTMIRIKMDDLQTDLSQILSDSKKTNTSNNFLLTTATINSRLSSSHTKISDTVDTRLNRIDESNHAKRSASVLATAMRPTLAKSDDFNLSNSASSLYSKSATNMREMQAAPINSGSPSPLTVSSSYKQPLSARDAIDVGGIGTRSTEVKSPLTISSTSYKYTPLRQSCSNLSLLSPSFTNISDANKKVINEENAANGNVEEVRCSPGLQKYSTSSRPKTADSLLSKNSTENIQKKAGTEEKLKTNHQETEYIYVDDTDDLDTESQKNGYFQKYRTQNIRQKKSQKIQPSTQTSPQRPHSASNLVRSTSNFIQTNIGTASQQISINSNKVQLARSNTNVLETVGSKLNGLRNSYLSSIETESDDTPTRLCSDSDESSLKSQRMTTTTNTASSSSSNLRTVSSISSRASSSGTTSGGPPMAINSNSLPRSRNPSGISQQQQSNELTSSTSSISNPSFMSATRSSLGKTAQQTSTNLTASTQFHSISSSMASNLVKNSVFQKKKNAFY